MLENISDTVTRLPPLAWLVLSTLFLAAGDFGSKIWVDSPKLITAAATLVLYCCSGMAWLPALYQRNELARLGTAWSVLTTVFTVVIGVLLFKESLALHHWFGIGLAVIALFLILYD